MAKNIVIVGAGNAALCAAIAAALKGANVTIFERAPKAERGGNSAYTGGAFRVAYNGVDDIKKLIPDLSSQEIENSDFGKYDEGQFFDDLSSMSGYRADMNLIEILVTKSFETLLWMRDQGVRFIPSFGRQSFKVNGKNIFWGGLTVEAAGGGLGLVDSLFKRCEDLGVKIIYDCKVTEIIGNHYAAKGIIYETFEGKETIFADAIILASGGFHANTEWRTRYLGKGWDMARVRGSRFNTGNIIEAALKIGARAHGNYSGCHSVFFDDGAEKFGNINNLNQQKNYFTLGIVVNLNGDRFFDEGKDFRNYTYSKMGAEILKQPGALGWQIFDAKTISLLPDEYRTPRAAKFEAASLEELCTRLDGINEEQFLKTIKEFNDAVDTETSFNPAIKDNKSTHGLVINKSNWANKIDTGPFTAFQVTCGITLTYGGLMIDEEARVINDEGFAISGLYATGELVGGLYYDRYPGGSGLMSGSVFGKIAGENATS